jgi:hypothetical protein
LAMGDGSSTHASHTNLSRSLTLSLFDADAREVPVLTPTSSNNRSSSIELIIPRDPNLHLPPMALQNVTALLHTPHHFIFNRHAVNLSLFRSPSSSSTVALHFEMQPLDITAAFLLIYRFDQPPQLNHSLRLIDGWSYLCPASQSFTPSHPHPHILILSSRSHVRSSLPSFSRQSTDSSTSSHSDLCHSTTQHHRAPSVLCSCIFTSTLTRDRASYHRSTVPLH